MAMEPPPLRPQANLFQVYLRLRPANAGAASAERFLLVEDPEEGLDAPTHITLNPPNDRRRAIEKFAFTEVFEEHATQLDIFHGTRVLPLLEGVLAPHGGDGTDGLLATLGVTGSGKTHTMLGSRSERGQTQLALDVIFRSIESNMVDFTRQAGVEASIQASDPSEAAILTAPAFLETVYSDFVGPSRAGSRAATPMNVRDPVIASADTSVQGICSQVPGSFPDSPHSVRLVRPEDDSSRITYLSTPPSERPKADVLFYPEAQSVPWKSKLASSSSPVKGYMNPTSAAKERRVAKSPIKGDYFPQSTPRARLQRPSALPQSPNIDAIHVSCDPSAEYAIVISMYEVYNDRIFDLLSPPIKSNATKEYRRRPLLFKSTELSSDRKVVAGLRKVVCGTFREAIMVLEAGLHERRVAGTGSNSVSSRSHGFFVVEVKKRRRGRNGPWGGSTLSIVDLAGSERARDAKTQGATLAEAGKINESLMYLGQCLQMQSDAASTTKPNLVPFRQCKLTELLFSNSFPSASLSRSVAHTRPPQKAVMIVTADPVGDFNATSQILRYSALAREVTVPRIPSIHATILATSSNLPPPSSSPVPPNSSPLSSPANYHHKPFFTPSGAHDRAFSAAESDRATMENAAMEIARMAEIIDQLNGELALETDARIAAEAHLLSMEDRLVELEQEIREECYTDFEQRLGLEMNRWKASLGMEQERGEEHWDRKVEVLARGMGVVVVHPPSDDIELDDDAENEDKENVLIENLEQENERLRREVAVLKRELGSRTPSKRVPLQERADSFGARSEVVGLGVKMDGLRVSGQGEENAKMRVSSSGSPTKKGRKAPSRKWDADMEDGF